MIRNVKLGSVIQRTHQELKRPKLSKPGSLRINISHTSNKTKKSDCIFHISTTEQTKIKTESLPKVKAVACKKNQHLLPSDRINRFPFTECCNKLCSKWTADSCHFCFPACQPVGVADINTIPDDRITASTIHDSRYQPYYGRLNGRRGYLRAWCTKTKNDRTDYLQVDMGAVRSVCAVATQGGTGGQWITSFKLKLSLDGTTFNHYMEDNAVKVNKFTYLIIRN